MVFVFELGPPDVSFEGGWGLVDKLRTPVSNQRITTEKL